jgi:signal transduction histidine kinase
VRSIFRIIFLRFLVMLALSFLGTFATRSIITRSPGVETLNRGVLESQLRRAVELSRSGGAQSLGPYLSRISGAERADVYVLDAAGRDLVDGTDRGRLLEREHLGFQIPFLGRTSRTRLIKLDDGSFSMVIVSRRQFNFKEFFSYYTWTFASILLLSWWLAIDLGSPLRKLRLAVDEFGHGDLTARAGSKRNDEIGELAASFDKMADRIQTLLTAERRLLQDISHELRSPLARLSCAIEIARNRGEGEGAIARIHKESQRLNNLVNQLLEVASAEGDPAAMRRDRISLNHLMKTLLDDCRIEAEAKKCLLNFREMAELEMPGDFELIRRAAENVLRNAIRYAPPGSAVEVELAARGGVAQVSIRDYGKGVPEELLGDIFKPFFRVESHRGVEGAGLGLALAQRAISLHQGKVFARNSLPGLLITIELPRTTA